MLSLDKRLDKAEEMIAAEFSDYYQTWRFGIGYGDLPLTLQSDFLNHM